MSITINICGRHQVARYGDAGITHIISIGRDNDFPHLGGFLNKEFTLYRFIFDDLSHECDNGPQLRHIERMIKIYKDIIINYTDANILFHCQMGMSRSTASAFIFCIMTGMNYDDTYKFLTHINGTINPNEQMMRYADRLLGHNGELAKFITARHI